MNLILRLGLYLVVCLATILFVMPVLLWDAITGSPRYLRILVGLDCATSATFGGDGHTTISRRAYLAEKAGKRWGCVLCKILDRIQENHCENS